MCKHSFFLTLLCLALSACASRSPMPQGVQYGFVSLSEAIPDLILEIRYHSSYNFVGARVDGYDEPIALLTHQAADSLRLVSRPILPICKGC